MKTSNIAEVDTIEATAATGTIDYDVTTQSVLFYTTDASGNWTLNLRGSSGTSLDTLMATGESLSVTFLVTQGATAYYNSAVTIDGSSVTPKWQGGTAPTSGNASSVDCYTYVIQKTGAATYVVLASQTQFA
jgi:VCBS repeat-containing protein